MNFGEPSGPLVLFFIFYFLFLEMYRPLFWPNKRREALFSLTRRCNAGKIHFLSKISGARGNFIFYHQETNKNIQAGAIEERREGTINN